MGQGFQVGCSIVVSYRKSARVVSFVRKGLSWAEAEQFMQGKKRRSVWKDLKHSPHAKKLSGSSKSKCQVEAERFRLDDQFKALPGSARPSQSVKASVTLWSLWPQVLQKAHSESENDRQRLTKQCEEWKNKVGKCWRADSQNLCGRVFQSPVIGLELAGSVFAGWVQT